MSDTIASQHYETLTLSLRQDGSEMQWILPSGTLDYLGDHDTGRNTLVISWDKEQEGGQVTFTNKVKPGGQTVRRLGIQTIIMSIATACIFGLAICCACLGLWALFARCLTSGVLCAMLTAIVSTLPGQRRDKEEGTEGKEKES